MSIFKVGVLMFKTLKSGFLKNPVLEMDVTEPTDTIILWGKKYRIYRDEWKHHVHLKCTNKCDADCAFCIERPSRGDREDPDAFLASSQELLDQMHEHGSLRTVSITGGEPTVFPRIDEAIEVANTHPLKLFSMNTNGRNLEDISPDSIDGWVNVSKHCANDGRVFRRKWEATPEWVGRVRRLQPRMKVRFQCVLGIDGGMSSLDEIWKFIDRYCRYVDDFSFRSLIVEDAEGKVPDLFWKFRTWLFGTGWCVEQTIQDYYVYETYNPPGARPITVSWANMGLLRRYNETHRDENFLEEIIVHPDGMVTGSWNKETLIIKK